MVIDEEQLAHHLKVIDKLHESRANLALVCGILYGGLHHVKYLLEQQHSFDSELSSKMVEAIEANLKTVNEIIEKEFYSEARRMKREEAPAQSQT